MKSYCIELTQEILNDPDKMELFQELMNKHAEATNKYIKDLAEELQVSETCAADVVYLRTRSRWTFELEMELMSLHAAGIPPNINEYGHDYKKEGD